MTKTARRTALALMAATALGLVLGAATPAVRGAAPEEMTP
jgi:hypothetical protein